VLELHEQPVQQFVERSARGSVKRPKEPLLAGDVRFEGAIKDHAALPCEAYKGAAPVVGVKAAFYETGLDESIEPLRDAAGGDHGRLHQVSWAKLVRRASTT